MKKLLAFGLFAAFLAPADAQAPVAVPAPGLVAQSRRIAGPIEDSARVTLAGSIPHGAQPDYDQGPADPFLRLPFITLVMKPSASQQSELERLIEQQRDRTSPNYHRWLTPEQFGDRFGLGPDEYVAVAAWLKSRGLRIALTARARNWIAFSGAVRDVESTFQTHIHNYAVDGRISIANATELSIPAALESLVSGIRDLDDFSRPAPHPENTSSSGVDQLAPDDWATIYDVSPLYTMGVDGTGVRIGILGAYDMNQSYIDAFRSQFGLPPAIVEQHLIGSDPGNTSSSSEAALDLEWAGAVARGATLVYIYARNFNIAAQAAVDQNLAPILNQSFGTCEPDSAAGNRRIAQQANAQGITWVASSGDSGAAGCDPHGFFNITGNSKTVSDGPAVDVPASFPEVTAVGGTEFNEAGGQYWRNTNSASGASAVSYIPETAWNDTGAGGLLASGGGPSIFFPKPAWQTGPGMPADNARDLPDLSFSASGNHDPYMVVNGNGRSFSGGTSASAPSFAGVLALLNHYLMNTGVQTLPGLGNVNPELYRLAATTTSVFHDITQANNFVACAPGSPGCSNGTLGYAAGPGYDLATGLGSLDVYNFVTQWNAPGAATTVSLTAAPGSITFGDSVQLTAGITPVAASPNIPGGAVQFSAGGTLLGTAPIIVANGQAFATLTVTGPRLPAGNAKVTAAYSGDTTFNPSTGSAAIAVAPSAPGSYVSIGISPNPVHEGELIHITLTEEAGAGTTVNGWTINGNDDFPFFVQDFGTTSLSPYGRLSANITTTAPAMVPSSRVYVFSGVDADGRAWSRQYSLTLEGPLQGPDITLLSAPGIVQQNPAADASCQWSQQLFLSEQLGFEVQLTRFVAGGADWTSRIQQLFGTSHLAPFGMLQGHLCWPAGAAPPPTTFEVDGTDQTGFPVTASIQATYTGPSSAPDTLAVAQNAITITSATLSQALNVSGGQWKAAALPANQSTSWLKASVSDSWVTLTASEAGLSLGVYNATLLIQAQDTVPQFVQVAVVFLVGASNGIAINGVTNGASFQPVFAPGMILAVFGSQLAAASQIASSLPLPAALSGVSATVNGVAAPFYYVSPTQLNLQIPYETGAGPAVLGVSNNGQVAAFLFQVSPAAPGTFSDIHQALVPFSTGKRGDPLGQQQAVVTVGGIASPGVILNVTQ